MNDLLIVTFIGLLIALVAIAAVALKGYALWLAARNGQKGWFVALLVINTLGILELIYIYGVAKREKPAAEIIPPPATPSAPPSVQ